METRFREEPRQGASVLAFSSSSSSMIARKLRGLWTIQTKKLIVHPDRILACTVAFWPSADSGVFDGLALGKNPTRLAAVPQTQKRLKPRFIKLSLNARGALGQGRRVFVRLIIDRCFGLACPAD